MQIAQKELLDLSGVFGLSLQESQQGHSADVFIDLLVALRSDLRTKKEWALSDRIRDGLEEQGVIVEDSAGGSTWHWK